MDFTLVFIQIFSLLQDVYLDEGIIGPLPPPKESPVSIVLKWANVGAGLYAAFVYFGLLGDVKSRKRKALLVCLGLACLAIAGAYTHLIFDPGDYLWIAPVFIRGFVFVLLVVPALLVATGGVSNREQIDETELKRILEDIVKRNGDE